MTASTISPSPDPATPAHADVPAAAVALLAAGFALCRIRQGEKTPTDTAWQLNPITNPADFTGCNVGLLTGPLSGGIMAVDLDFHTDDAEAWAAADELLPPTGMIDGRPGKPTAHRFYRITDKVWPDRLLPQSGATRQAMQAGNYPRFVGTHHWSSKTRRNIDLHRAAARCVIPPSLHESGSRRGWYGGVRGDPTDIGFSALYQSVLVLVDRLGLTGRKEGPDAIGLPIPDPGLLAVVPMLERVARLQRYLDHVPPMRLGEGEELPLPAISHSGGMRRVWRYSRCGMAIV